MNCSTYHAIPDWSKCECTGWLTVMIIRVVCGLHMHVW